MRAALAGRPLQPGAGGRVAVDASSLEVSPAGTAAFATARNPGGRRIVLELVRTGGHWLLLSAVPAR